MITDNTTAHMHPSLVAVDDTNKWTQDQHGHNDIKGHFTSEFFHTPKNIFMRKSIPWECVKTPIKYITKFFSSFGKVRLLSPCWKYC